MKLKEEYKDEIQEMIKAGETKENIAKHYGVTRQTIYRFIEKYNLSAKKDQVFYVPANRHEVLTIENAIQDAIKKAINSGLIDLNYIDFDDVYSYVYETVLMTLSSSPWDESKGKSLHNYIFMMAEHRIINYEKRFCAELERQDKKWEEEEKLDDYICLNDIMPEW